MKVPLSLEPLFNQAYGHVRRFIQERGEFTPFALTIQASGEFTPVQVSEDAREVNAAIAALLRVLIPWAKEQRIVACCICLPIPKAATRHNVPTVLFDLESNKGERVLAVMQLSKTEKYGWNFGPIEFKSDAPKLFAT